jgi:hypothetical protein
MSYKNSALNFLWNYHTVFCRNCIILHFHQQCTGLQSLPSKMCVCGVCVCACVFVCGHLSGCEVTYVLILIWTFLMVSDVEHLCICFLGIYMCSEDQCPRKCFAYFLIDLSLFLSWNNCIWWMFSTIIICWLAISLIPCLIFQVS